MAKSALASSPLTWAWSGVPTGIQIVGRSYDDVGVFRTAAAYEAAAPVLDWANKKPSL